MHLFGHAGGVNLFLQLIELALLAAAQLFLDGLDLLVEVVLFLRFFHLPLHPRLDGAVHVQLFDLDIEHVGNAVEPLDGIENLQQLLLFFDGKLQIGRDGVGEPRRIVNLDSGDHGLVIQRLAKLHVLLEQRGHALNAGFHLRGRMRGEIHRAHRGLEVTFVVFYFEDFAALHAFDENLDVAILQLQSLHDVDDGADLVDLVRLGLVNAGVVLGGQKDLLVGSQRCFQGAHAGFPAHHEWGHHEREDHHVPYGHHGQLFAFEFFGHRILFLSKGYHAWQVALMRQRGDLDRYFGYWGETAEISSHSTKGSVEWGTLRFFSVADYTAHRRVVPPAHPP